MPTEVPGNDQTQAAQLPHAQFSVGQVVAERYQLQELLGVGGMGIVFKALDMQLNVPVALKLLRPELTIDATAEGRFRQELILARQITHPNVVRVHDLNTYEGHQFISMDYVRGRTLAQLIQEQAPLTVERVKSFILQLAAGLAAAHARGVIHRDLKPGNILVDEQDKLYITDFGVAHSIASAGLTRTGDTVGTLDYLSPEQASGEPVDERSDLYALGLIACQLLTGELPFVGTTATERLSERLTRSLTPRIDAQTQKSAPELVRLIKQLLQRDPKRRQHNAKAVVNALSGKVSEQRRLHGAWPLAGLLIGALAVATLAFLLVRGMLAQEPSMAVTMAGPALLPPVVSGGDVPEGFALGLSLLLSQQFNNRSRDIEADALAPLAALKILDLPLQRASEHLDRIAELLKNAPLITATLEQQQDGWHYRLQRRQGGGGGPNSAPLETIAQVQASELSGLIASAGELAEQLQTQLAVVKRDSPLAGSVPDTSAVALGYWALGRQAMRMGDLPNAEIYLSRSVEEDARFLNAWLDMSLVRTSSGQWDQAMTATLKVAELAGEGSWQQQLASAQTARIDGDYDSAAVIIEGLREIQQNNSQLALLQAEVIGEGLDLEQAIGLLQIFAEKQPNHPRVWYLLGKFAIQSGDSGAAVDDYLVKALVIQNRLQNPQGRADVVNALGVGYERLGQYQRAIEQYQQAADLRLLLGDNIGTATSLRNLAGILAIQGDFALAKQNLEQARTMLAPLGPSNALADVFNDLGFLQEEQGQYPAALKSYREALALRQKVAGPDAVAESHLNLGFTYSVLGQLDNAQVYADQARSGFAGIGDQAGVLQADQLRARLLLATLEWPEAQRILQASLKTAEGSQMQDIRAAAHYLLGNVSMQLGQYQQAWTHLEAAQSQYQQREDQRGSIGTRLLQAEWLLRVAAFAEAAEILDELLADASLTTEQQATVALLQGSIAMETGEQAEESFARAQRLARASGNELLHIQTTIAHARSQSDLEELHRLEATAGSSNQFQLQALQALTAAQLRRSRTEEAADSLTRMRSLTRRAESLWLRQINARFALQICQQQTQETGECPEQIIHLSSANQALADTAPEAYREGLLAALSSEGRSDINE